MSIYNKKSVQNDLTCLIAEGRRDDLLTPERWKKIGDSEDGRAYFAHIDSENDFVFTDSEENHKSAKAFSEKHWLFLCLKKGHLIDDKIKTNLLRCGSNLFSVLEDVNDALDDVGEGIYFLSWTGDEIRNKITEMEVIAAPEDFGCRN